MNAREEVAGEFVVSGCDGPELLELGEEVLDQMARRVERSVEIVRQAAVGSWRDAYGLAGGGQRPQHPLLGVVALVGDQRSGLQARQQLVGSGKVVGLASGQVERGGIAERIDQGVYLGGQSAAGSADRLVGAGFFWAPALC